MPSRACASATGVHDVMMCSINSITCSSPMGLDAAEECVSAHGSSGSLSSGSVSRLPAKRCTTSRVTAQHRWSPTAVPSCPTRVQRTRELLLSLPGYRIQIQCSGTALGACAFRCTAKQALSLLCIEAQSMRIRGCTHCSAAALPMLHHVSVIRVPVDRHLEYAAARECTHADLVLVVVRCHAAKSGHVRPSARLGRAVHHDGGSNLQNAQNLHNA